MWDWLSNLWDKGSDKITDWLFDAAGSAFGEKQGSGLMRPQSILDGIGPGRQYGNESPTASKVRGVNPASYDEITLKWQRRMAAIKDSQANDIKMVVK